MSSRRELDRGRVTFPLQVFEGTGLTEEEWSKVCGGRVIEIRDSRKKKGDRLCKEGGTSSGCDGSDIDVSSMQFRTLCCKPPPFITKWGSVSCSPGTGPAHNGTGTYVYHLSPVGDLSALVVNQKRATETRIIFFSPLTQVGVSVYVYPPYEGSMAGR